MPLISVIVPVYKVEAYLPACVSSILMQTFTDFELILVDDGSPDICGAMCDSYAQKDSRVRVIHRENGGLSAARNTGLDAAGGDYVTFIDSDDVVSLNYLQYMIRVAEETAVDVVAAKIIQFTDYDDVASFLDGKQIIPDCQVENRRTACLELYDNPERLPINSVAKLFRRNIFCSLRFPEGRIHEDQALIPLAIYAASRTAVLDRAIYGYRHNENGIMHSTFSNKRYDDITAIDECIAFFESKSEPEIVLAAKKKREVILAKYSILARNAGVTPPQEYQVPLCKAMNCLRKNVSTGRFEYYMGLVHPALPIVCAYIRKIKKMIMGRTDR